MDCCNYMSYRQSSQYYSPVNSPYYECFPYAGDFYGHPSYHDYYGNTPYYTQHWPCAASFPDYVYNPKEARLRKAMREATRDRAMGAAPMVPPRPGSRRPSGWIPSAEDLMMTPQPLRGSLGSPMCATSGFPMASTGSDQFISMNGYGKIGPVMPPHAPNNYLQPNPMAHLQHQADMWQTYQTTLRARQTVLPQYMVPHSYQQPELMQEVMPQPTPTLEKPTIETDNFTNTESNSTESIPPTNNETASRAFNKTDATSEQSVNNENNLQQPEQFIPMYEENVLMSNPYEKSEEMKKIRNKPCECNPSKSLSPCEPAKDTLTYLMDPTLAFLINDSSVLENRELNNQEYIKKYFENFAGYDSMEIPVDSNNSFNYVTYASHGMQNYSYQTALNLGSIGSNLPNKRIKCNLLENHNSSASDPPNMQKENPSDAKKTKHT